MKNERNYENCINLGLLDQGLKPKFYYVVIHNDDFTPMEFVVSILETFFFMDRRQAAKKMLEAHIEGKAACGVYNKDIAETKIAQVMDYAKLHQHPFHCSMEVA